MSRAVYRALLRECNKLGGGLTFREPVDLRGWQEGVWQLVPTREAYDEFVRTNICEGVDVSVRTFDNRNDLRSFVAQQFRAGSSDAAESTSLPEKLDVAINGLRELADQAMMEACSSTCTTQGIHVEVTPAFHGIMPGSPQQAEGHPSVMYSFTYRPAPVQLTGRHFIILDSKLQLYQQIPRHSPGVIGQQPTLAPGQMFIYYSGAVLPEPSGQMLGHFHFVDRNKSSARADAFDAVIKPFKFLAPPKYFKA